MCVLEIREGMLGFVMKYLWNVDVSAIFCVPATFSLIFWLHGKIGTVGIKLPVARMLSCVLL